MTMAQAEEKMACLREVFTVVRLLKGSDIEQLSVQDGLTVEMPCQCYSFWHRQSQCANCISKRALKEKRLTSKIEVIGSEMYQVFARYVRIDHVSYVIEMIEKLSPEAMLGQDGYDCLLNELSEYNNKLYRDALTGAYNRRFYEDEVKEMTGNAGIAVLDLDDFKVYNDTYGHDAGDIVLERTADIIRGHIRKTDILIRYGGDEFLLILPDISRDVFSRKLNQVKEDIAGTRFSDYKNLRVSVSIGGVMFAEGSIEDAVSRADQLMYIAKTQKNMVVSAWDEESRLDGSLEEMEHEGIKQQLLIVDDSEMNRELLTEILKKDYRILEARDGDECLKLLNQYGTGISLILLDIVMPQMDGFEVLAYMNRRHWIEDIPVIMISSENSERYIRKAYELGASDFISRPFDARIVYRRVFNMIKLYAKQRRLIHLVTDQIYEKERNNRMMISILSQIVEFRNGESGLHVIHINVLTELLLEQLVKKTDRYPLTWSDQYLISTASALHDIGKIGIDEKILNKPGRLTKEEFEIMKTHTTIGAAMLDSLDMFQDEKLIKVAHEICRWHHERYDGRGYPDGLVGDEIPISAQVVALADVYDALVSKRVYKNAFSHEQALDMIMDGECGAFNPLLLDCLCEIQDQIRDQIKIQSPEDYVRKAERKTAHTLNDIAKFGDQQQ